MKNWQEKLKKGLEYHKIKIDDKYYVPLEYVLDDIDQTIKEKDDEWREKIKEMIGVIKNTQGDMCKDLFSEDMVEFFAKDKVIEKLEDLLK